jgi:lysozyme family protein
MKRAPTWQSSNRWATKSVVADATNRFSICIPYTLIQECPYPNDWSNPANFSDDPHDPGGATMCGIVQSEYDEYRKSVGQPIQSVKLISKTEGYTIYQTNYWQPYCPQLPVGLDLSFFDSAVNMGVSEAIRIIQFALSINDDGVWGPITSGAVKNIIDVSNVITAFTKRRQAVYESFSGFQYFGQDWTRRTSEIGQESLTMAAGAIS